MGQNKRGETNKHNNYSTATSTTGLCRTYERGEGGTEESQDTKELGVWPLRLGMRKDL